MRIGDRVIFKPYGDESNPENWRRGVIVAEGYGPNGNDHVFVRYDKTDRTNATAVKALTVDKKGLD